MKNLINFFFSFDKLMKEKLIVPFFWLAIIVMGSFLTSVFLDVVWKSLATVIQFLTFPVIILFSLVSIRLVCELMVAIFRINNNLSPDGGKSETANIDPMVEARKAAEAAALRAREISKNAGEKASAATKSAVEKTKHAADNAKDSVGDAAGNAMSRTKSAASDLKSSTTPKTKNLAKKNQVKTPISKIPSKTRTPKKPAVSKKKSAAVKKPSSKTSPVLKGKPGPKAGTKSSRDAQGRLLKKDGTPRKSPKTKNP